MARKPSKPVIVPKGSTTEELPLRQAQGWPLRQAQGLDSSTGSGLDPSTGSGLAHSTGSGLDPSTSSGLAPSTGSGLDSSTGSGLAHSTGSGLAPSTGSGLAPSTGTGLDSSTGTGVPVEVPAVVEFVPVNEAAPWRVEKCDLLATEFGLSDPPSRGEARPPMDLAALPKRVAEFVFFCQSHPRLWLLARRLYGIAPLFPPRDSKPEDLRVWTRAELTAEGYEVKTDLEALRGFWVNHCQREGSREARGRRSEVRNTRTSCPCHGPFDRLRGC